MKFITPLLVFLFLGCGYNISRENPEEYQNRNNKAQTAVSEWIKKYALYPESYEPISFSDYSESYSSKGDEKIPNSDNYVIKHVHKIKDKTGTSNTFFGYFILEHDYFVSVIEIERSKSMGGASPPKTEIWMEKFGRELTKQDSLEFNLRHKQMMNEFTNEMKEGLDNGSLTTENDNDMKKVKSLLDTLDEKK